MLLGPSASNSRAALPTAAWRPGRPANTRLPANETMSSPTPIFLFDVMDTIVKDPFYEHMPTFFNLTFKQLLEQKHPTAWIEFEKGLLEEEEFYRKFFKDGREVNGIALKEAMVAQYVYLAGMEEILKGLRDAGYEAHLMTNYPSWYRAIESKLRLSRYAKWTFTSCDGCMKGLRKPDKQSFLKVVDTLAVPPSQLVFVDDRIPNVEAAIQCGLQGILFKSSAQLKQDLEALGVHLS